MRALGELAHSFGHTVTGSDRALGEHSPENVKGCDLVVYTNAVAPDNCELAAARAAGIPTIERAEYLGEISRAYGTVVAFAGCHGKSTATAMTGAALTSLYPTVHVGAVGASKIGSKRIFVTEACEYNRSFLHLKPDIGVILNIGYDHPDCYPTKAALFDAYRSFAAACKTLIVNGDDAACQTLSQGITFGLDKKNTYTAENISSENGYRSFDFTVKGMRKRRITLPVPGEHSVCNALAALAVADVLGVNDAAIGIEKFCGVPRRFERLGFAFGKTVITDYAHHPSEIAATIKTAREMFPSVAVVFQPHTYSRTAALLVGFAESLAAADTVILAPVFAAREKPVPGISSHSICRALIDGGKDAYCFDSFPEIINVCKKLREKCVIFMGAGDIDAAAKRFVTLGEARL